MAARTSNTLLRLARRAGIETRFIDELGHLKEGSPENLQVLLDLLNRSIRKVGDPGCAGDAVAQAPRRSIVRPTMLVRHGALPEVWHIHLPVGKRALSDMEIIWSFRDEAGAVHTYRTSPGQVHPRRLIEGYKTIQGRRYTRLALPFPQDLQLGYYDIRVSAKRQDQHWQGTSRLIVTPTRCYLPPNWHAKRSTRGTAPPGSKWWGLTVQLYGLRSRQNWGIGDFRDLRNMMRWAARMGAAMVGVNPLHALPPGGISPYSPSSRLFHHPIYLDIVSIPECRDRNVQRLLRRGSFQRRLQGLRQGDIVNYEAVHQLKWRLFKQLYRVFATVHLARGTRRGRAFEEFVRRQGLCLERFALFQALQERFTPAGAPPRSWREWPPEYRHPDSFAVQRLRKRLAQRVNFFCYLEWQCDEQLRRVQSTAQRTGMPIGLYTDFAIGIDPHGADAWAFQDNFAQGASVGAPPDLFSPRGQNWGLAPPHPERIAETGYRLFVEGFRRNMRHSGLLRLDHAMGLFRLFWVPDSRSAADGAYVRYPSEDLLAILALESRRQNVIVVGEDLGTVTPEIRTDLVEAGLLSYRLLFFEKSPEGEFTPPHRYPSQAMTAVTTHDLPTLRGFWSGRDIQLKEALGLYPDRAMIQRDKAARNLDRQALLTALKKARVLPSHYAQRAQETPELDETLRRAVYTFLARTPSYLLAVPLEDLLGDRETPNLPGASDDAYPVWRMKAGPAGSTLDTWARLPGARMLAELLRSERPSRQFRDTCRRLAS